MICQKCDKGKTLSAKIYHDEKSGFNVQGVGKFVEQKEIICPCCGGQWENCQKCDGEQKVNEIFELGIAAYNVGKRDEARNFFIAFTKQSPDDERAWEWMSKVVNNEQERDHCLKQLSRITQNSVTSSIHSPEASKPLIVEVLEAQPVPSNTSCKTEEIKTTNEKEILELLKKQNTILENLQSLLVNSAEAQSPNGYRFRAHIVDVDMTISAMASFMIKWVVASIPAGIVIGFFLFVLGGCLAVF